MEVSRATLEQIFSEITNSVGYKTTVLPLDKSKVTRRLAGEPTKLPGSLLARAAWRVAALLTPLGPPPPPPPPPARYAPQTYNKGSSGQDARYCTAGLSKVGPFFVDAKGCRYDDGGRDADGCRSGNPVSGLKPADEMDGKEPCDPYNGMPPWPAGSYER